MFIVSQERGGIVNTDKITVIALDEEVIKAYFDENDYWNLGVYENEDKAKEVFEQLMNFLRNGYESDFFYMPPNPDGEED